jgi:hypothetical protein
MPFNPVNWGVISSKGNTTKTLQDGTIIGAPGIYTYQSATETIATISAVDYFAKVDIQLAVNDLIWIAASDLQEWFMVLAVDVATGNVIIGQNPGLGDVTGPAVATDNALVRFDGVTGKLIQNGVILESDTGDLTLVNSIANAAGLVATPSYTFTGDLDTGMWHSGANTVDFSTNAFRALQLGASPALSVNYLVIAASATGNGPTITAAGTDAVVGIRLVPKSTGAVINNAGAVATPSYSFTGNLGTGMWSSAGGVLDFSTGALRALQLNTSPALSVNYLAITSAATGNGPILEAEGTDANIDIYSLPKGTGGFGVRGATNSGSIKLWNQANTFFAQIQAAAMASSITWTWPLTDGAAGQVLTTSGAGVLSWVNNAAGSWISSAATPVAMVANTGYINNVVAAATFNMPAAAAVGDEFELAGNGAGGWTLQMNAGQTANLNGSPTSVAGTLASTNRYNCIKLLCTVANTTFTVLTSSGVITVA